MGLGTLTRSGAGLRTKPPIGEESAAIVLPAAVGVVDARGARTGAAGLTRAVGGVAILVVCAGVAQGAIEAIGPADTAPTSLLRQAVLIAAAQAARKLALTGFEAADAAGAVSVDRAA